MEYFLGSIITIAVMVGTFYILRRIKPNLQDTIKYSQSHIYNLIQPYLPPQDSIPKRTKTQLTEYEDSISLRIVFLDDKAYWIKDNTFYVADAVNKTIQHDTATQVDTMSVDKVQLNKLMEIVEILTEGRD